jgi:hypothetical protein
MEIVPIEIFGVAVDVPFPKPLGARQARLEEFSAALCDPATGLGLRPDQIRLRQTDELFQYELDARFFGENGWLTRTAERVKMGIRNARTAPDWKIITELLQKFYDLVEPARDGFSALSTHAHARFPSAEDRDHWLSRFAYSPLISRPASLGYVQIVDWEKEVRVLIEQSNAIPDAVFIAWDTQFRHGQDWASFLPTIPELMENSANLFDLGFEPLRRTV